MPKIIKDTLIADNSQMDLASKFGHIAPVDSNADIFMPNRYVFQNGYGPVDLLYWHEAKYDRPLFLTTNLDHAPLAASYYRKRYHIETFFDNTKSIGFNICRTKIEDPERLFNLMILVCLVFILAILFEFEARQSKYLPQFCRKDRIDSLFLTWIVRPYSE